MFDAGYSVIESVFRYGEFGGGKNKDAHARDEGGLSKPGI
jgi:hypothetical protein